MKNRLNNIHCEVELTWRRSLSGLLWFVCARCDVTALCAGKQGTKLKLQYHAEVLANLTWLLMALLIQLFFLSYDS